MRIVAQVTQSFQAPSHISDEILLVALVIYSFLTHLGYVLGSMQLAIPVRLVRSRLEALH
jgi:hypothetical protein